MSQSPQHNKIRIQKCLEKYNVSIREPKNFDKDRCKVSLESFKGIQDSFVVDIDTEIDKKNSKVECKGKRCDFILWVNKCCVLIEAKSGRAKSHTVKQFKNTLSWLKRQKIVSTNYKFLLIGKVAEEQINLFQKESILRCNCGDSIYEYLKKKKVVGDGSGKDKI